MAADPEPTLMDLLEPSRLRRLAGWTTYERGMEYAEEGRVRERHQVPGGISGVVDGTLPYLAALLVVDGELDWVCECPIGIAKTLCKHVVALGLAELGVGAGVQRPEAPVQRPGATRPSFGAAIPAVELTFDDAAAWLRTLDPRTLAALVLEEAVADPALQARLLARARVAIPAGGGIAELERAFDHAIQFPFGPRGRPEWGFLDRLEDVIDRMERFLAPSTALALVGLVRRAITTIEELLGHLDDSDGDLGGLLGRLIELHLDACTVGRPDPMDLAGYLFGMEIRSDLGLFHGSATTYADVLGEAGLAEYRRLLRPHWDRLPTLAPGDVSPWRRSETGPGEPDRWRIAGIAVALADASGDLDERVRVRARDLGSSRGFLEIARVCLEAGAVEQAIDWAERGVRAFESPGTELRRFLVERYQELGRHEEALALSWADFVERPDRTMYRNLLSDAARAGATDAWRERALAHARSVIARDAVSAAGRGPAEDRPTLAEPWSEWASRSGASVLVELLLADGDDEVAWAAAVEHGCFRKLWLELAGVRADHHPRDAAKVYRREAEALIEAKNRGAYQHAAKLAARVVRLEAAGGHPEAGQSYLADLRERNKRRPAFLEELARAVR